MALQSQTTSPLTDFGALLRRHVWSILLPFAFITALGVMVAELMPKQFMVKTVIKLPESGMPGTGSTIQRDVGSAKNDMVAEPLVRSVIESQEWSDYVGLTEKEKIDYVRRVVGNTKPQVASASKGGSGSSYITVIYTDSDATRAERFLNALRDRYIEGVVKSLREDARATRDMLKELRDKQFQTYKDAEKAKTELAKAKNISATQPAPGTGQARGEDPLFTRLTQSQIQLGDTELALKAEAAKLELTQRLFALEPEQIPEAEAAAAVAANAAGKPTPGDELEKQVRDLELQIFDKREKQKDYRPLARAYQVIDEDVIKLETKIAMLKGDSASSLGQKGSPRFVANPTRAKYDQAIQDSKSKIEVLKVTASTLKTTIADLTRDHEARQEVYLQLSYLAQDAQRASEIYLGTDGAYQAQLTRVTVLEGKGADPFDVTEVAVASDIPLAPNVPVFIGIAAFLGLAVGLGSAVTGEFLRNGFRGIPDLTRGLGTPVLGAVNSITTRAQARRTWTRHVMIAASSAVIVSAILWITWAYQHDSLRLLGPGLTQIIDNVRLAFRP